VSEADVRALYERILDAWNRASADDFAGAFAEDGEVVGFDGSQMHGRDEIADELGRIFADHETGRYVGKVRRVRPLGDGAALLTAVAGMVPTGQSDLNPDVNTVQILVAEQREGQWHAVAYQNTPAQLHGRPELVEQLTEELRQER
jgi:uncharacterized protein (TIGR02246 family)